MLDDGADGRFPEAPREIVGEDAVLERDGFGDGAGGRQGSEPDDDAEGRLGAGVHLQAAEDEDGDGGADEVGEGVEAEADVAGQVGDVRGEALPAADPGVPHGGHGAALQEEEQDLGRVARGAEGDDDPEEGREVLAGPADDA